ncbi:DsrE family protein [Marichromatium bheemlicum]|uniref:Intracellular sulfur oxidation DsrE/DsrF family protein n=1 Tax=Marichromatium bheemlicum TaxID=365339 RepID=A0ABX1I7W9_9GAMM|nr:DsrE family protein [Marichromatium bheemlicum]NKN33658.1 hypothetical protein [Marichromatium bheemlicum]
MHATRLTFALLSASIATGTLAEEAPLDVVYHVSETDKVAFVLNNMQNHIDGVGGPDQVNLVLVAHGPAIRALDEIETTDRIRDAIERLRAQGVALEICGNTLEGYGYGLEDLVQGFSIVEQGGVTRIAELQSRGYVYLRP